MKINYEKIRFDTGITFEDEKGLFDFLKTQLDYLMYHNKNYTNLQYSKLQDIYYIIKHIEED